MKVVTQHRPVILLLGKRAANHDEVDAWLAKSRYSIHEATDVFHALEQISDFTVRETPDVVFLHVDRVEAELEMLENVLDTSVADLCPSVIAFSGPRTGDGYDTGFGGLARRLDQLIPDNPQVI